MVDQMSSFAAVLTANAFAKTDFIFSTWNTKADGTGTSYKDKASYPFAAETSLYAQWVVIPNHTVTFDSNGGSGSMALEIKNAASALTANTFTRAGFKFTSWNTAVDGSGTSYADSANYAFDVDVTLFALWSANPRHTVLYVGGTGSIGTGPSALSVLEGTTFVIANNTFTRPDYAFSGWGDGTSVYNPGDIYTVKSSDITFTALWSGLNTSPPPTDADLQPGVRSTIRINIPGINGTLIPVVVDVPAGTIDISGRIRVVSNSSPAQNSLGEISLNVQILDVFGKVIPKINRSLVFSFVNPVGKNIVAESQDGFTWRAIPRIPNGGTTIAPGQVDGYYLDSQGHVVIVTSHLSFFGFKKIQTKKVIATVSPKKLTLKTTAKMRASGGSGTAAIRFFSSTPQICIVSTRGVVKALSGGTCRLVAVKGGDSRYLHQSSAVLSLKVVGPSIIAFGTGTLRQITVDLGAGYGGKSATIQYAPVGATQFTPIAVVKLSSLGRVIKSGNVPNGSVLRVQVAGKTIATFGVPGK